MNRIQGAQHHGCRQIFIDFAQAMDCSLSSCGIPNDFLGPKRDGLLDPWAWAYYA